MAKTVAIATHNLTKQFSDYVAVRDVELEIYAGEIYGLIGPNGAGKTTLIRMLAAAEEPTFGEILINGHPLRRDRHHHSLQKYLGYLPDDYPLYNDLSVWDYLDYFARLYKLHRTDKRRRIHEVLELVQLTHKRDSYISTLSRGMKQRVGLARTIIHQPLVLLLDEPVSGLDPVARAQFRDIISALKEAGMTILISSHVLSDLEEMCTSIGIMELGSLVESATLKNLYHRLSRQRIQLSTMDSMDSAPGDRLAHILDTHPLVGRWRPSPQGESAPSAQPTIATRHYDLDFTGDGSDCAVFLKSLISEGIEVIDFHPTQESLEDIFFKIGHQQSS